MKLSGSAIMAIDIIARELLEEPRLVIKDAADLLDDAGIEPNPEAMRMLVEAIVDFHQIGAQA